MKRKEPRSFMVTLWWKFRGLQAWEQVSFGFIVCRSIRSDLFSFTPKFSFACKKIEVASAQCGFQRRDFALASFASLEVRAAGLSP